MSASAAEANNDEGNDQKGEDADDSKGELFGSVKGFFLLNLSTSTLRKTFDYIKSYYIPITQKHYFNS